MKTFIVALLAFILVISGTLVYSGYVKRAEREVMDLLDDVKTTLATENWNDAENGYEKLNKIWNKHEKILAVFNDHEELDDIRLSFADLKESIAYKSKEYGQKAIERIKVILKRIRKNESLTIENVLSLSPVRCVFHIML